jgi:putative NADPH-quinone reductase
MRALVVFAHPHHDSFVGAALQRAEAGLARAGHEVTVLDLYREAFDPCAPALPLAHRDLVRAAELVVFVYPTWWSAQPAILTGWLQALPRTRVPRVFAVTTHGSVKSVNVLEGEAGKRTLTRALRSRFGLLLRTQWIAFYGTDTSEQERRDLFLVEVEERLARS